MPIFHFDRRRLRRTAWATLVVWLFALAAGVVNACALTSAGPAERAVSQAGIVVEDPHAVASIGSGHASHQDPIEAVSHHGYGHGQDSGKISCLKFCDDEASAIAKVELPVVDLGSSLLTVVEAWNPVAASGSLGLRPSLQRPGSRGPQLVIRFLRLTL
jgi:hypothetical protein